MRERPLISSEFLNKLFLLLFRKKTLSAHFLPGTYIHVCKERMKIGNYSKGLFRTLDIFPALKIYVSKILIPHKLEMSGICESDLKRENAKFNFGVT